MPVGAENHEGAAVVLCDACVMHCHNRIWNIIARKDWIAGKTLYDRHGTLSIHCKVEHVLKLAGSQSYDVITSTVIDVDRAVDNRIGA